MFGAVRLGLVPFHSAQGMYIYIPNIHVYQYHILYKLSYHMAFFLR